MINPRPCSRAWAYVDPIFTNKSHDISISTSTRRTNLSVFLVLMLMLMSIQFSLACTCACAYALVKTRLKKIVRPAAGTCTLHVSWGEILHFKHPRVSTVNCIATRTFRDKQQQQQQQQQQQNDSFFRLNFNVFIDVENRERSRERDKNKRDQFCWKKNMKTL